MLEMMGLALASGQLFALVMGTMASLVQIFAFSQNVLHCKLYPDFGQHDARAKES